MHNSKIGVTSHFEQLLDELLSQSLVINACWPVMLLSRSQIENRRERNENFKAMR